MCSSSPTAVIRCRPRPGCGSSSWIQATRIEVELAAHLPADPATGRDRGAARLHDGGEACSAASAMPTKVFADAWGLGIAKIPAVVVDRRYVVHGEPDVPRAVARINAYRSTQP